LKKLVVGLMCGTSVDGVDAALVEIDGSGLSTSIKLIEFITYPIDPLVRKEIFAIFRPEHSGINKVCHMNFVIGELFAQAANSVIRQAGLSNEEVCLKQYDCRCSC